VTGDRQAPAQSLPPTLALPSRRLGRSPVRVTELSFGGAAIGGLYTEVSDDDARAAVDAAWAGGIRTFDTAPHYGLGLSERRLGDALRHRPRDEYVISTKVGRLLEPAAPRVDGTVGSDTEGFAIPARFVRRFDFSADGVRRSLESSLDRLGLDRVDIVLMHDPDNHWEQALTEAYPALERLRGEGVVQAIGLGMNQWQMLVDFANAGDFDCFLLAGRYTLLEQESLRALLPLCVQKGIGLVIGGPFNSGILATGAKPGAKYFYSDAAPEILERTRRIERVCTLHEIPLAAAALQFALGHPVVASVATGMVSPQEVETNLRHMAHAIPEDFWLELKQEGLLRQETPIPQTAQAA